MGQKAAINHRLKWNAIYSGVATQIAFGSAVVAGISAEFTSAATAEKLGTAVDTLMCGGILAGMSMAISASFVIYKYQKEADAELAYEAREERLAKFRIPNNDL